MVQSALTGVITSGQGKTEQLTNNNIGQVPCTSASFLRYTVSVLASVYTASVLAKRQPLTHFATSSTLQYRNSSPFCRKLMVYRRIMRPEVQHADIPLHSDSRYSH